MNYLFDEILEFQFKIPFIFRLKIYYILLRPTISSLLYLNPLKHAYLQILRAKHLHIGEIFSMIYSLFSPTLNHSLLFVVVRNELGFSKRVTSTWLYTRIRSKREVFHWRESGGGWRWRTAAMIIITGHWGCARVEGCIVSGRGHRWQAPRFQRGAPRPTLQLDRYFPVP